MFLIGSLFVVKQAHPFADMNDDEELVYGTKVCLIGYWCRLILTMLNAGPSL